MMQNPNQMNFMRPQSPNSQQPQSYPQNYQQQFQPIIQPRPNYILNGRVVYSANEIQPGEVPMDGSTAIFPLSDWTQIIVKTWNTNGTIGTITYVPSIQSEKEDISTESVMDAISSIKGEMAKLQTTMRNIQNTLNKQNRKKVPDNATNIK